jgi:DNA-binding protein YbaB
MTNIDYHTHLKTLVRNSEDRYIDSKKQLEDLFKYSKLYDKEDLDWLKEFWRESKNKAESELKQNQKELTHYNQGMNPPFCYPY